MTEAELIALYKIHYVALCKVAFRYVQDEALAEDLVQNFFISLFNKRPVIKSNEAAFLKKSVINTCINELNKKSRFNFLSIEEKDDLPSAAPNNSLEVKDLKVKIKQAINNLPPKCRTIFLLKRKEKYSNKEIAEFLSISIKTVENQITIALKQLQQHLHNDN